MLIPLEEYLEQYCSETHPDWYEMSKYINKAFNIKSEDDYIELHNQRGLRYVNIHKMIIYYKELKQKNYPFDDDILRYIAFLYGSDYFEKIGSPSLEQWLNAKNINKPFEQNIDKNEGFSIIEVVNLKYGINAIHSQLLSALKWIGSQGG